MTLEDEVEALRAEVNQLRVELEFAKQPRFGEAGYQPPPQPTHKYKPHRKWPWWCSECGYPEHERLKHSISSEQQGR